MCVLSKFREERGQVAHQPKKTSHLFCGRRSWPGSYAVCFSFVRFNPIGRDVVAEETDLTSFYPRHQKSLART